MSIARAFTIFLAGTLACTAHGQAPTEPRNGEVYTGSGEARLWSASSN